MTKRFLPFAAMVMALPLAIMARSITLPLTSSALEFGKSLTTFGGRPISSALLKSLRMDDMIILPILFEENDTLFKIPPAPPLLKGGQGGFALIAGRDHIN